MPATLGFCRTLTALGPSSMRRHSMRQSMTGCSTCPTRPSRETSNGPCIASPASISPASEAISSRAFTIGLDPRQRKAQGGVYTPPSIARYMLDRLGLTSEDSIIDPSCGSGTFLIERYQQVVGEDADPGRCHLLRCVRGDHPHCWKRPQPVFRCSDLIQLPGICFLSARM